ncbi:restriction endonuclease [Wielerella bovis]|uniref:restriction endonuclease n=1 Tax=Wielerella bovis TaxID=2917790 RepID=UPI0020192898|nr:restriction endonuclease [Wielerella bovis]MCG7656764.1 Mrr restriction system protein [Wielerella bovis]MCG7658987.1 Mrr restriction system protein [Wielerella bovis]ULJ63240.1 Mrr restriction system protein [Wielerella bovis]ULJ65466.1 Mrr restriction system protein [Wielerella bovis]ULJ67811.1 Mrr restriction system protein [Wielerella bovis]
MKFEEMKRDEQYRILMPIVIKLLQNLGGKASRKELRDEIKTSADEIPEAFIDKTKPAKNGGVFYPFNFIYNFSITNLEMAGFLTCPQRGEVALTEKGRMCQAEQLDIEKDVYVFSKPQWAERKANRKKQPEKILIEEQEEIDEANGLDENWQTQLKQLLLKMPPKKFETFCRLLVRKMGVDIDEDKGVSPTRDGGIDGYGYIISDDFRTSRVAIQAKRWDNEQRIGTPEIDKFVGAMVNNNAEFGIFITTAYFSRDAQKYAREGKYPITLIDGDRIIELVEKYQLYIKPVTTYQLDKFYFEEN